MRIFKTGVILKYRELHIELVVDISSQPNGTWIFISIMQSV